MTSSGRRAVVAALAANLAVAASKLVGFAVTGSTALLAESFHSVADTGNQGLLLLGAFLGREPPSPAHPFGRGRERYFWAFVVGLVLFGAGGVLSIVEGARRIGSGEHEVSNPVVGVVLIVVALGFELASLRVGVAEATSIRPAGQSWWTFVRRTHNPEVAVVLLEDGAAVCGLGVALAGIGLSWLTGNHLFDAVASVAIGVLLCCVAGLLAVKMKGLLIGETIPDDLQLTLRREISSVPGVERILNLRTEHLGPEAVLVCAKIAIDEPADLDRVISVIDDVEAVVAGCVPTMLTCYVEPDRFDPRRVDTDWT